MDIHHDTSFRDILEDDSISFASRTCICSCSGKGVGIWLVVRPSIHSFRIAHSTFISTMHFCLNLIKLLASSIFMCECGHRLNGSSTHLTHWPFGGQQIATHDTIKDIMYAFVWKSEHIVWREWWYSLTLKTSLWTNFCMIHEDQVFVVDVVVIDLMRETVTSNVISRPWSATMELNAITKIRKYKGLHEGHHFIPMALEVHSTLECDVNHFIRECAHLFHDRQSGDHLSLFFCIQFCK
jgi:hypothetical protein